MRAITLEKRRGKHRGIKQKLSRFPVVDGPENQQGGKDKVGTVVPRRRKERAHRGQDKKEGFGREQTRAAKPNQKTLFLTSPFGNFFWGRKEREIFRTEGKGGTGEKGPAVKQRNCRPPVGLGQRRTPRP